MTFSAEAATAVRDDVEVQVESSKLNDKSIFNVQYDCKTSDWYLLQ